MATVQKQKKLCGGATLLSTRVHYWQGYDHRANENGRLRDLERNSQSHRAHSNESKRLRDSVL